MLKISDTISVLQDLQDNGFTHLEFTLIKPTKMIARASSVYTGDVVSTTVRSWKAMAKLGEKIGESLVNLWVKALS